MGRCLRNGGEYSRGNRELYVASLERGSDDGSSQAIDLHSSVLLVVQINRNRGDVPTKWTKKVEIDNCVEDGRRETFIKIYSASTLFLSKPSMSKWSWCLLASPAGKTFKRWPPEILQFHHRAFIYRRATAEYDSDNDLCIFVYRQTRAFLGLTTDIVDVEECHLASASDIGSRMRKQIEQETFELHDSHSFYFDFIPASKMCKLMFFLMRFLSCLVGTCRGCTQNTSISILSSPIFAKKMIWAEENRMKSDSWLGISLSSMPILCAWWAAPIDCPMLLLRLDIVYFTASIMNPLDETTLQSFRTTSAILLLFAILFDKWKISISWALLSAQ